MSKGSKQHRGMVSVDGYTYRIERIAPRTYEVVRLNDDVNVGTFKTGRTIRVFPIGIETAELESVARLAVKLAKTSWVSNPRPTPPGGTPAQKPGEESAEAPPVSSRRGWAPA